jgi:hypothetical protein
MTHSFFRGGLAVGLVALLVGAGVVGAAHASTDTKYSFIAKGTITDVDEANHTIKVDVTKVDGRGKNDMEGSNIEFITNKARVVKVISNKDHSATWHTFKIGQLVGMKGVAKQDDTYVLSFARIEERNFTILGRLEALDTDAKTMKILVESSAYKPATYKKGTQINMTYTDDTTFYEKATKNEKSPSDVNADAQRVKVMGAITGSNTWEVAKLWDNYKGK